MIYLFIAYNRWKEKPDELKESAHESIELLKKYSVGRQNNYTI